MAPRTQPAASTGKDDFDAAALARQVDDHTKDMASLIKRLDELEARFGSNEKIANTLCEVEANAVKMNECLEKGVVKIFSQSEQVNKQIKKIISETDREFVAQKLKQYSTWVAAAFLFLVAQISIELVKWLIGILHSSATGLPHP